MTLRRINGSSSLLFQMTGWFFLPLTLLNLELIISIDNSGLNIRFFYFQLLLFFVSLIVTMHFHSKSSQMKKRPASAVGYKRPISHYARVALSMGAHSRYRVQEGVFGLFYLCFEDKKLFKQSSCEGGVPFYLTFGE